MKQEEIDSFFRRLDEALGLEAEVILLGAGAGALMGHIRPSLDIDFEIRPKAELNVAQKERVHDTVVECSKAFGVAVNFSDNISHWSMINFLDYRQTAIPYKKIGKLNVKLIAPEYWTIGKMTRFLELDVQDMMSIIKLKKMNANSLIEIWAKALKTSELSLEMGQFRKNIETFLNKCGPRLWGRDFDPLEAVALFYKHAGIKRRGKMTP